MTSVRSFKSLSAILVLVLMLSLLSLNVFATDGTTTAPEGTGAPETAADTSADTAADTAGETTAADTTPETTSAASDDKDKKAFPWDAVISFGIVALIIIVLLILYFVNPKFKKKMQDFTRNIKSELKKVVWSPAKDVKKNTVIVLVFVALFALMIGLLDFVFSKGIIALGKLF